MPRRGGVPWWGWLLGGCLGLLVVGGIACGLLGGLVGSRLGAFVSRVTHEQIVSASEMQTFTVTGSPRISIDNMAGNISYQAGTGTTVTVEIIRRASDGSAAAAQADLRDITATATQTGDTITIQSNIGGSQGFGRTRSVDLVITGPAAAAFDIINQTGDVDLENVVLANGSRVHNNVGTVIVNGQLAASATVDISAGVGSVTVTLPAQTNTHLSSRTNTGTISITGWSIPSTSQGAGQAASGDLGSTASGSLTIQVNVGSITLTAGS